MNSNFRNFAIWVFIGLLLVALFNLFQSPGVHVRGNEISFSQLLSEVESGNVQDVTRSPGTSPTGAISRPMRRTTRTWSTSSIKRA